MVDEAELEEAALDEAGLVLLLREVDGRAADEEVCDMDIVLLLPEADEEPGLEVEESVAVDEA